MACARHPRHPDGPMEYRLISFWLELSCRDLNSHCIPISTQSTIGFKALDPSGSHLDLTLLCYHQVPPNSIIYTHARLSQGIWSCLGRLAKII